MDLSSTTNRDRQRVALAFGFALREFRNAKGISQENLGLIAGMAHGYPGRVETGARCPSLYSVLKLSAACDADPLELFKKFLSELRSLGGVAG